MSTAAERLLGLVAAISLEAGWILLLYVLVEGLAGAGFVPLSGIHIALAAALGLAWSRFGRRLASSAHALVLAVLVVGVALVGWLAPVGSTVAQLTSDPAVVLGAHPGGLLLGLAVLRGAGHGRPGGEEAIADQALGPGLALVAAAWLVLTISGLSRDPDLAAIAFAATVTFLTASLVALGLARLEALPSLGDPALRRGRWLPLLFGVVVAALAIAIPLAAIVGLPVSAAVYGVLGPVGVVLVAILTLVSIPLFAAVQLLVGTVSPGRPTSLPSVPQLPTAADIFGSHAESGSSGFSVALGVLPLLLGAIVAVVVIRSLIHRPAISKPGPGVEEVREVELAGAGIRIALPRRRRMRRATTPRDASEAYLAAIRLLDRQPVAARRPSETPLEHARRVEDPTIRSPIRRLAADYVLGAFAGHPLTANEHRRAIGRWRSVRSGLGR